MSVLVKKIQYVGLENGLPLQRLANVVHYWRAVMRVMKCFTYCYLFMEMHQERGTEILNVWQ